MKTKGRVCSCSSDAEGQHFSTCALWGGNDAARRQREATALAIAIKAERNGLDREDEKAEGIELRSHARAKVHRDRDRAKLNGMVIALSYWLGDPVNMKLAEAFIAEQTA